MADDGDGIDVVNVAHHHYNLRPRPGAGGGGGGDDRDDDPYSTVLLRDVGGLVDQKKELETSVLRALEVDESLGQWAFTPPRGILFYGPPGTGKTLLARAFGNELSRRMLRPVSFIHQKGGDFLSSEFGVSEQMIKNVFREAKEHTPSIIFLDELDGICPTRSGDVGHGEGYNSIVATILSQMDILPVGDVFIIAATNRLEAVDPGMLRPGRFDIHLEFHPPNAEDRKTILRICTQGWPEERQPCDVILNEIMEKTQGYSGADLNSLAMHVFQEALDRHNGSNNSLDLTDLNVTHADWHATLGKMNKTSSRIFGSSLYSPDRPCLDDCQLVKTNTTSILEALGAKLAALTTEEGRDPQLLPRTLLVVDSGRTSFEETLEDTTIPAVLTDITCNNTPIYCLDRTGLSNHHDYAHPTYVTNVVNQAANCQKPCILYLPKIDELVQSFPHIVESLAGVDQLRGRQVQILSTASCGANQLPHSLLQLKFVNNLDTIFVTPPTPNARKDYLEKLFIDAFTTPQNPAMNADTYKDVQEDLLTKAVHITGRRNVDAYSIKRIFRAIHFKALEHYDNEDKKQMVKDFHSILNQFFLNQLTS